MNLCLARYIEGDFTSKQTFEEGGKKRKKKDARKFLNVFSVILTTAKGRSYS